MGISWTGKLATGASWTLLASATLAPWALGAEPLRLKSLGEYAQYSSPTNSGGGTGSSYAPGSATYTSPFSPGGAYCPPCPPGQSPWAPFPSPSSASPYAPHTYSPYPKEPKSSTSEPPGSASTRPSTDPTRPSTDPSRPSTDPSTPNSPAQPNTPDFRSDNNTNNNNTNNAPEAASSTTFSTPNLIGDFFGRGPVRIALPGAVTTNGSNPFGQAVLQSISVNGQPGFRLVPLDPVNGPIVNSTVYTTAGGGDLGGTAATSFLNVQQLDSTNGTVIDPGLVTAVKTGAKFGADPIYSLRDAENTIAPAFIGAGLVKIVENVSPIPKDRIYFNFSAFDNVPISNSGITVNRFTPGIEKTFLDGNFSIETRVPFATTLDSNVTLDGLTNTRQVELGNVAVTGKVLFYSDDHWAFSGGVQTLLPTADDLTMNLSTGEELLRVKNQSVHVQPFFGSVWTPSERFFMQSILQVDAAANSNTVLGRDFVAESAAPAFNGTRFKEIGKIDDVPFLYATAVGGYWLAHPDEDEGFISGFATTLELHYNRSLKTTDRITDGTYTIGDRAKNIEVLNMTIGGHMKFSNSSFMSVGYTVPLAGGADEQFDGEVRVMLNYLFGDAAKKRSNPLFR